MNVKLKICGMRDSENIRQVGLLKPDFMGFIFHRVSPRCVPENFTLPKFDAPVLKAGVFVNEKFEKIMELVRRHAFQFVQLHGDESVSLCDGLKASGVGVIKSFSINEDFDFRQTEQYESTVDYFLFDTKGKHNGGNGFAFDWNLLNQYNQRVPFFLSGGISPENVKKIRGLGDMNLYAIDVNSGIELEPGLKDVSRLELLLENLKV